MKASSKLLALGLALGVISTTARAQELIHVSLSFSFSVQSDPVDDGTTTKTPPPAKLRVSNKQILQRIAEDHGTNYPSTAKIALTNDQFVVVDTSGAILDSIPELSISFPGNSVDSGSSDDHSDAGTRSSLQIVTLTFDETSDGGQAEQIQFSASGIFKTKSSTSKPDSNNEESVTASGSGTLAGSGSVGGKNLVVSGNISGSGKGTFTLP